MIDFNSLSPYSQSQLEKNGIQHYKAKKMFSDFTDKQHYVIHYMNLQLYLQLGLKLRKVHRILQFEQQDFAKEFINFTTAMRSKAETKIEEDIWKFINNILYVRKYMTT